MRGFPNNPVPCDVCGKPGYPKLRLCNLHRPTPRKKFEFTTQMDDDIREVWTKNAKEKPLLTAGIDRLARKYPQFPRHMFKNRAQALGLTFDTRHRWTEAEENFLRDNAGEISVKEIAKRVGHGWLKVRAKMEAMGLSRQVSLEGYGVEELASAMGVAHQTVLKWERAGLLRRYAGRYSEQVVIQFIRNHPEAYDLRRVDQVWWKSLVFPSAACFSGGNKKASKAETVQGALQNKLYEMGRALA